MGLSTAPAPEIRSSVDHVAAGAAIGGRVVGFAGSVNVVLVRRERSPAREHLAECASVTLRGPRVEQFRLDVPPDLPPTASSRRCAIDYWLAANEALGDGRLARAAVTVAATAAPHVEARGVARDRMLAHSAARRFHLELSVADLCGGGRIRGRVHRHGAGPAGPLDIDLCCVEAWRALVPTLGGIPHWERAVLWQTRTTVDVEPDRTWSPFAFDIPGDLPPAVEAHAIAWRYELSARRPARIGLPACAALTPLLHELS